ncbi:hypothetical protein [Marinilactibacillus sp. Marseille-P9653]|uniref:hypothetical protein n=1 Tax=Marinilactibacillus sp. Marseille-P9653 TaxID=2866583 RepID=UPI001CE44467|nr:hypothetical protein [Marinilactibacillus sp. Marseille-P9653]
MVLIYDWLIERVRFDLKKFGPDVIVFVLVDLNEEKTVKEYYHDSSNIIPLKKYNYLELNFEEMSLKELHALLVKL